MKKIIAVLLAILLLLPSTFAFAKTQYIIPDSDTRRLSESEIRQWDYESIGFIFNEIFARHGYNFIPGEKYDLYFRTCAWYRPNANKNNTDACYPQLNSTEWANEKLCKEIRKDMLACGTKNNGGKNYLDVVERGFDVLSGFDFVNMSPNQKFDIYSAPSYSSYRGANGKACVSTNGAVYIAGIENGWYLSMYETNNGAVRVGYFDASQTNDYINTNYLDFLYNTIRTTDRTFLTDDPATGKSIIMTIYSGTNLTFLSTFVDNRRSWAYVETTYNGRTIRGFVPMEDVDIY